MPLLWVFEWSFPFIICKRWHDIQTPQPSQDPRPSLLASVGPSQYSGSHSASELATQHLTRTGSLNLSSEPAAHSPQITSPRAKSEENVKRKWRIFFLEVYDSWKGTFVFTRGFMRTRIFCCWGERLRDMRSQWSSIFTTFSFWWRPLWRDVTRKQSQKVSRIRAEKCTVNTFPLSC